MLEHLPPELLARILCEHLSWAAIELWKCGNRSLMAKMMNYGVRELNLEAESWPKAATWPRCLKHFRLRSLAVTFHVPLTGVTSGTKLREYLMQLPPTLEKLELEGPNVLAAFRLTSASKSKSKASSSDDEGKSISKWDMNVTHPRLRHLRIGELGVSEFGYAPARPKLRIGSYALLPRSLTYLNLRHAALSPPTAEQMADFPRGLETLAFASRLYDPQSPKQSASITATNVFHLPPSITDLGTQEEIYDLKVSRKHPTLLHPTRTYGFGIDKLAIQILLKQWKTILPNLKHFPIPKTNFGVENTDYNYIYKYGLPLPDCILSVALVSMASQPPPWPSSLTELELPISNVEAFSLRWIKDLPSTLTKLKLRAIAWDELDEGTNINFFQNLPWTSLTLGYDEKFAQDLFRHLPRSLRTLDVNSAHHVPLKSYPNMDRESILLAYGIAALAREPSWERLKQSLLTHPTNANRGGEAGAKNYISAVESGRLFGLPLGLTTLRYRDSTSQPELEHILPPQLHTLHLWAACPPCQVFKHVPPSLTDVALDLTICTDSTAHWISLLKEADESQQYWMLNSAPNVMALQAFYPFEKDLAIVFPRSLQALHLEYVPDKRLDPNVATKWLESVALPPALRSLTYAIGENPKQTTSRFMNFLPKTLETLILPGGNVLLHPPDLASLPSIRRVEGISFATFSLTEMLSLPRSLPLTRMLRAELPHHRTPFPGLTWSQFHELHQKGTVVEASTSTNPAQTKSGENLQKE